MRDPVEKPRVSVVIPCLDEAETIAECVTSAVRYWRRAASTGRSSSSTTALRTAAASLRVWPARSSSTNLGAATAVTLAGLAAAQGDYVVMLDADLTYDFREIPRFVQFSTKERSSSLATA